MIPTLKNQAKVFRSALTSAPRKFWQTVSLKLGGRRIFSLPTLHYRMGNALTHPTNKNDPTGFQVTTVQPLSPGAECGLKCNEDFIIKLNGKTVSATDPNLIMGLVQVILFLVD